MMASRGRWMRLAAATVPYTKPPPAPSADPLSLSDRFLRTMLPEISTGPPV